VIWRSFALTLCLASSAVAQTAGVGQGATLRVLDKLTGELADISLASGDRTALGLISIEVAECRYPLGNPASDAFAFVEITEVTGTEPVFKGWMVASSPALNAVDHGRYDVWVLRCSITS